MEPATRACMSNLLIWCATQEQARGLPIEIGEIVEKHPSRVLLLVGEPEYENAGLSASVSAVCHPASAGRQICSEHVTLSAPTPSANRLPSIARPLLIGDLPTALWWAAPEPPTAAGALFDDLAGMADHVIYDSAGWLDPVRGVVSVASWEMGLETRRVVSDLAWRRGKPWRRLVSQTLDPLIAAGGARIDRGGRDRARPPCAPAGLVLDRLACGAPWLAADRRKSRAGRRGELGIRIREGAAAGHCPAAPEWRAGALARRHPLECEVERRRGHLRLGGAGSPCGFGREQFRFRARLVRPPRVARQSRRATDGRSSSTTPCFATRLRCRGAWRRRSCDDQAATQNQGEQAR